MVDSVVVELSSTLTQDNNMAHVKKQKKSKAAWKTVQIEPSYLAEHQGNELISLEVLTDYTIGKDGVLSFSKPKKSKVEFQVV